MSALTMCPSCQAAVPSGQFCAICGAPLGLSAAQIPQSADHSPQTSVAAPTPPLTRPMAHGSPPPSEQLTASAHPLAFAWPSSTVWPGPEVPEQRPMGDHAAHVSAAHPQQPGQLGHTMAAFGGLRGVRPGRQQAIVGGVLAVVVAAGFVIFGMGGKHTVTGDVTLIGVGGSSAGSICEGQNGYDDITGGAEVRVKNENGTLVATGRLEDGTYDGISCVFPFTVHDVPRASYYEISAGNDSRGGVHFSSDELESEHWSAHLSLGN